MINFENQKEKSGLLNFKQEIKNFFKNKDLNLFYKQIYQFEDFKVEDLNYLFQISNKNSLLKRKNEKVDKYLSFSTNLLNALFYLDLRFIKDENFKNKLESDLLKNQNEPVLLIFDFKDKFGLTYKNGIENFEILLKTDFLKEKFLVIDSFLKFKVFLKFLKQNNKDFDLEKLNYFIKTWKEIEEFNKKFFK